MKLTSAGIHVLVEKPISNSISGARALIKFAQDRNVRLLVGHYCRFNPSLVAAKKIIESGSLGRVIAVNGLWTNFKPPEYFNAPNVEWRSKKSLGGGVILINFIHEIDLMHYLFGPVTRIHAEKTTPQRQPGNSDAIEEGAAITLRF